MDFTLELIPEGTSATDTTDPTVGGDGVLSTSSVNSGGFTVDFTKSTDNETAQADLRYYLYTSTSDNLSTVSDAETNGTLQNSGGTLDVSSLTASGLNASTTYYFNIVVEDEAENKSAYTSNNETTLASGGSGLDSRAGDEAALESLYSSTNGASWTDSTGWASSGMSLGDTIFGVTTETIGGELRVTEIDLRYNNLTGSIDITEWENLKQLTLLNLAHNSMDTQYPDSIHDCTNLEHLYLNYSDHSLESASYPSLQPHEYVEQETPGHFDPGKDSGTGNTIIRGAVPSTINQLTKLRSYALSFTDDHGENSRTPNNINGIESLPDTLWDISTLELLQIYDNWNIGNSGNTWTLPDTIGHITNLKQLFIGGGNGTTWDEDSEGFLTGGYPSDLGDITTITTWWTERHAELEGFPDMTNSEGLISIICPFTKVTGSLPDWLSAGTHVDLDSFAIGHPIDPFGFEGNIPEPSTAMTKLDNYDVVGHRLTGSIPTNIWDIDPNKINFGENQLTSIGQTDLSSLTSMSTLRYYRNDVEGEQIPLLDWSRGISSLSDQFNQIRFEENRYVFADMLYIPDGQTETAIDLYKQLSLSTFRYGNQKPAGTPNSYSPSAGTNLTISDFTGTYSHTDNVYQWQKDGSDISNGSKYSGVDSKELTINDCQSSDDGTYTLVVTNSGLSELTLTSADIEVTVN